MAGTIHGLPRNLTVFVRERSNDEGMQRPAEANHIAVLQAMRNDEMEPWDMSPTGDISPTGDQDGNPERGKLTVETATNGPGRAGRVEVPRDLWDKLRPCNWAGRTNPSHITYPRPTRPPRRAGGCDVM